MSFSILRRNIYRKRSNAEASPPLAPRTKNWSISGLDSSAIGPTASKFTGTSRQKKTSIPSSIASASTMRRHCSATFLSRGRKAMPTPYLPRSGRFGISRRKNSSGIWVIMPAPSPVRESPPTAPRCMSRSRTSMPFSTISCFLAALMSATSPTPQASCSFIESYIPCGRGKPLWLLSCCINWIFVASNPSRRRANFVVFCPIHLNPIN